jgi:hypothetical protein
MLYKDIHTLRGAVQIEITVNFERGTNYINGKPEKVKLRANNVSRHENEKWKMIGHHIYPLPWLEKKQGGE